MNQQYEYPPPPPQRSPGAHAPSGGSFPDRRPVPVQPPSITTNIARTLAGPGQTPISATTLGPSGQYSLSPNTPATYSPRSPSGLAQQLSPSTSPRTSTMEPYNPRQWSNRGQVSGAQMVFQQRASAAPPSTRNVTGMEGTLKTALARELSSNEHV